MANILFRTKGNANPKGKPRVYFTCHPADFEKYFDKVCGDIFKTHDCAIYYTEDMSAVIPAEDLATDLGSNNLFVIPVTLKLLTQPNRAMDQDFAYAQAEHIPVLPILMEPGLDMLYSRPDKFGKLQYLNPCSTDLTEISYGEKLKKFLEAVLISDELAQRVRAAFDAYIFLSYRKKDRRYANELMRMIHKNPECRDIAIWYDEFLTPGESFQDSIEKILHSSKLFTLLVTPNLLEEPEGKPNFVMAQEYPAAKEAGIDILPAEMEPTDKAALGEKFAEIPDCVDVHDEIIFRDTLLTAIRKAAITSNDTDPEHNFLIGLAYLEGIDVEMDRRLGRKLIANAAESGLPEAMKKMFQIYHGGAGVIRNYRQAAFWAERLVAHYQQTVGLEHPDTLHWMHNLSNTYSNARNHTKALELNEHAYTLSCKVFGNEHPDTLNFLNNLASTYCRLRNFSKALELGKLVYAQSCKVLGEKHPDTITVLRNLAIVYRDMGDRKTALELLAKVYTLRCEIGGEEHPDTITSLCDLATAHEKMGEHKNGLELREKAYALTRKAFGENHFKTRTFMKSLITIYGKLSDRRNEAALSEELYALDCKYEGEDSYSAYCSLRDLAAIYHKQRNYAREVELREKLYALDCKQRGAEDSLTLDSLHDLAIAYSKLEDHKKALELFKKVYALRCKVLREDPLDAIIHLIDPDVVPGDSQNRHEGENTQDLSSKALGEEHPDTLTSLCCLAVTYSNLGNHKKALELFETVYTLRYKVLGEEHLDTITALNNLSLTHYQLGNYAKAAGLMEQVYSLRCTVQGENHPLTQKTRNNLTVISKKLTSQT